MEVPSPHALARQLSRLLPRDLLPTDSHKNSDPGPNAERRILDAALARFTDHGVGATTMSAIARDAGISREWLYRHFRNRDAVVIAVTTREVSRLIDGLASSVEGAPSVEDMVTEAFAYAVDFLRGHALLQRVLRAEPKIVRSVLLEPDGSVLTTAVDVSVAYLLAVAPIDEAEAVVVAETLVRLVLAIIVAPHGRLDLDEPVALRHYIRSVVRPMLAGRIAAAS
jgi:AcrR family transcriptional regulator